MTSCLNSQLFMHFQLEQVSQNEHFWFTNSLFDWRQIPSTGNIHPGVGRGSGAFRLHAITISCPKYVVELELEANSNNSNITDLWVVTCIKKCVCNFYVLLLILWKNRSHPCFFVPCKSVATISALTMHG